MTLVKPNERELDSFVKEWSETKVGAEAREAPAAQRTISDYISEIELKSLVTRQTNIIAKKWVKELTCDAIGYSLFGPAYLFAALDFLTLTQAFDDDLQTHPPNRMRFRLLYDMLDNDAEFFKILNPKVLSFLMSWKEVTLKIPVQFTNNITKLAGNAIMDIYKQIIKEATSAVGQDGLYSASKNVSELRKLIERANAQVLPNESIINGTAVEAKFPSILNAGWIVYLGGLEDLQVKLDIESWDSKVKFNELIARAIELNEVQRRWNEI